MTVFWSSPGITMTGSGDVARYDPRIGSERYRLARDWLDSTGREIGFASFAFDRDTPGSVVLAPQGIVPSVPTGTTTPPGRVVDDGRSDWEAGYLVAMAELSAARVGKVVLARQVELDFDDPVPVPTIVERLVEANPDTYVFSVDGMVGACPELLVSVDGDQVTSLVLAGTARTAEGLDSNKISDEHRYAADSVASALADLTIDLVGEQSVLTFGMINHVGTRFIGRRRPGVGILDLVAALHPTASVGGTPSAEAVALIRGIEPRSRGNYAGPIGWFDTAGNGEFSLALRCGLIRSNRVTLYAGGGLVATSDRESEWDETELKLGPMLQALNVKPNPAWSPGAKR